MLIWHIDEEIIDSKWNSNSVNNDEEHKGVDLEEADGEDDLDSKTNYGDSDDPYILDHLQKTLILIHLHITELNLAGK